MLTPGQMIPWLLTLVKIPFISDFGKHLSVSYSGSHYSILSAGDFISHTLLCEISLSLAV